MPFKLSIYYRNSYAHYDLLREAPRIYTAELVHYDGCVEDTPPKLVLLLRGTRSWWGSAEDKELVATLGSSIETLAESHSFFTESTGSADAVEES